MTTNILLTTSETIGGRQVVETLGMVQGNTVQTRHLGEHIIAAIRALFGGEVKEYVAALNAARQEADMRMVAEAAALGADAIICIRYSTSSIMAGGAEILVYGTAVKLK